MKQPIQVFLCALLLAIACSPAQAQKKLMRFQVYYNGIQFLKSTLTVEFKLDEAKREILLTFTKPFFGPNNPESQLVFVLKEDSYRMSSENLELMETPPQGLIMRRKAAVTQRFRITGTGKGILRVDRIYCRGLIGNEMDRLINIVVPAVFPFEIGGAATPPSASVAKDIRPSVPNTLSDEAEATAFHKALRLPWEERVDALKRFLEKYPQSKLSNEAKKHVPLELIRLPEREYARVFTVRYACSQPIFVFDSLNMYGTIKPDTGSNYEVVLQGNRHVSFEILLIDTCKNADVRINRYLINAYPLLCILKANEIAYELTIYGGYESAPYAIEYMQGDSALPFGVETLPRTDTTYRFLKKSVRERTGTHGIFTLRVLEGNIIQPVDSTIYVPPGLPVWPFMAAGSLFATLVFGYAYRRYLAQKKAAAARMIQIEEIIVDEAGWVMNPSSPPGTLKVRVPNYKKIGYRSLTDKQFSDLLKAGPYQWLNTKHLWPDTVLTDIYFNTESIQGIRTFLQQQPRSDRKEVDGTLPEVGGLLTGQYWESDKIKQFRVVVTGFLPTTDSGQPSHFRFEDLASLYHSVRVKDPLMSVLGWVHTHHGEGLFLSQPDLTLHDLFFVEDFQFALEIDTMTPQLDAAIFTRKTTGDVNNTLIETPEPDWFHWKEIDAGS